MTPPVSSAHTGHKRERREGESGGAGREKYGGGGGVPILRLELDRNWIDGWSGLFMAEIWSCFDFMAAYFHVKSTKPVV